MTRRGFTMLELVLSLAITVLVAAGVAAMLGGIATGIALGSDTRTGLLATAATHGRLTEDLAGIASVLGLAEKLLGLAEKLRRWWTGRHWWTGRSARAWSMTSVRNSPDSSRARVRALPSIASPSCLGVRGISRTVGSPSTCSPRRISRSEFPTLGAIRRL